jgi:hypothetical protein
MHDRESDDVLFHVHARTVVRWCSLTIATCNRFNVGLDVIASDNGNCIAFMYTGKPDQVCRTGR